MSVSSKLLQQLPKWKRPEVSRKHNSTLVLWNNSQIDDSKSFVCLFTETGGSSSETRQRGKCKWFNVAKGWGFITTLDDAGSRQDVFVHQVSPRFAILTNVFAAASLNKKAVVKNDPYASYSFLPTTWNVNDSRFRIRSGIVQQDASPCGMSISYFKFKKKKDPSEKGKSDLWRSTVTRY